MREQKERDNLNFLGDKIDQGMERDRNLDISHVKSLEILKNKIPERGFDSLYGKENVDKDLNYVAEHFMIFKTTLANNPDLMKNKKFATVLEAIFTEKVASGEWFGPGVGIIIPSRFDEIKNGIDSIIKFQEIGEPSSYLALAIDITFSKNADNKIHNILKKIKDGESSEVKYFQTKEFKGQLLNVPKVVIGVDKKTVKELSYLWNNDKKEELNNHPVLKEILSEIVMQLEKFEKECRRYKRDDLAERYNHALLIIQKIVRKKGFNLKSTEGGEIYESIKEYLNKL